MEYTTEKAVHPLNRYFTAARPRRNSGGSGEKCLSLRKRRGARNERDMKRTGPKRDLPRSIRDWLGEILGFLLKKPLPRRSVRLLKRIARPPGPEIGLIIQLLGEGEGEIVLLASRETARSLIARLFPERRPAADSPEEMALVKSSLGEILNILSAKLLSCISDRDRLRRVTTPSCIFGRDLFIMPEDFGEHSGAARIAVETPFGRIDIYTRGCL
jgi:CheY-specific phosphatase CheX